jgi:hypothetical protein
MPIEILFFLRQQANSLAKIRFLYWVIVCEESESLGGELLFDIRNRFSTM